MLKAINPVVKLEKQGRVAVVIGNGPTQGLLDADKEFRVQAPQSDRSHTSHILLNNGVVDVSRSDGFHQVNAVEAVAFNNVDGVANLVGKMLYEFHLVAALRQMYGLACEVDGRTQQLVLHLIGCRHLVPVLWETLHQNAALLEDGVGKQEAAFHVFVRTDADGHYVDLSRVEEHKTRVEVLIDQHLQFDATIFAEIAQELVFKARWR